MLVGCHGSVWTGTFDADGIRLAVRKTAEAGYDLIEIPLMDPYGLDVEVTKKALAENGLQATASLGLNERTDLSSDDPQIVAAGEKFLGKSLEVLSEIGATNLVGVIYCAMRKYSAPSTELGRRHSTEAIRRLAARGEQLGVRLGVEVVNRYETNMINTGRQALAYVAEVGSDNVDVHLDTYHMNIEEADMFSPVLACGPRLGYVHVGESHRGYLGSGTVDFDSFFRGLAHVRYDGVIVFESFSSAIVHEELSRSLAIWRNLWSDSEDLAAHANAFVRNHLRSVESIGMH
jgi:D-psicose/D-tagatose/L-ribulose 3-epimerase